MKIAIIGAGIAGLTCARGLVDAGHDVVVFELEAVPGGRVATLKTELGGFDHCAQYLTARDPAFVRAVDDWSRAGVVASWPVSATSIDAVAGHVAPGPTTSRTDRWVGVPGMSAIAAHLADGLDVRYDTAIAALDERPGGGGWSPRREGGDGTTTDGFDAVVVALPAEKTALLLDAVAPALARRAATVRIEPCWAVLLGFTERIDAVSSGGRAPVGDAAFVAGGRLAWIARESSKPGRRPGERWTVHAQSGWSVEHFDDDPEDVETKLVRAFRDATGTAEQPIYAHAFRWRHALARSPLAGEVLWDPGRRIGACGDWCRGYRIEDAWSSGRAMADAIGPAA